MKKLNELIKDRQVQENWYNVTDSNGRPSDIYVTASNIKEAYVLARIEVEGKGFGNYWKLKRSYSGGVRG